MRDKSQNCVGSTTKRSTWPTQHGHNRERKIEHAALYVKPQPKKIDVSHTPTLVTSNWKPTAATASKPPSPFSPPPPPPFSVQPPLFSPPPSPPPPVLAVVPSGGTSKSVLEVSAFVSLKVCPPVTRTASSSSPPMSLTLQREWEGVFVQRFFVAYEHQGCREWDHESTVPLRGDAR